MVPQIETGQVFPTSFKALSARFGPFFGSVLAIYLPLVLAFAAFSVVETEDPDAVFFILFLLGLVPLLLLSPLATAAVVRGVFLHLRGEDVRFADCWYGLGSIWSSVIVASVAVALLSVLGFAACIVPGLIIQTGLFVAIPCLVVERDGVGNAFSRSWNLTDGNRLQIFFIVLGLIILGLVLGKGSELLGAALSMGVVGTEVLSLVVQAFLSTLQAVVTGVVYFELRRLRDGTELEELAAVFD